MPTSIALVGFDGDDTLWRSEDFYRAAQAEFETLLARYVPADDLHTRLYAVEKRNLALFGYGAKGMTLSMLEAAYEISEGRVASADLHRIVELGKTLLRHPVELLPGIRAAVERIAREHEVVLITKGDLFRRIEIVSEKDGAAYARVLREFDLPASRFVMIGNSLRSDIAPVLALGGWGVHMPYHVTWVHETEAEYDAGHARLRRVERPDELPDAIADIVLNAGYTPSAA